MSARTILTILRAPAFAAFTAAKVETRRCNVSAATSAAVPDPHGIHQRKTRTFPAGGYDAA
jgi:hypothetical protein